MQPAGLAIRSAEKSLRLSVFRCDDLEILSELGDAVARGVRVEALITSRAKGWTRRLAPLAGCLQRMGVIIHPLPAGRCRLPRLPRAWWWRRSRPAASPRPPPAARAKSNRPPRRNRPRFTIRLC
ncbi:MAG: hypothetical protein FJW20_20470 [Acidimicrobiia bacterium]|nr:hypothetical protein [Acidimicrobiia bacterium]